MFTAPSRESTRSSGSYKDFFSYLIAALALIGFTWFIIYLLGRTTSATELEWTRAVYLLSGVEAIVFAAAGFLFGRDVHRVRAEKAEKRAENSEISATEAKNRAVAAETKGESLTAAITNKLKATESKAADYETFGAKSAATMTQADLKELAEMAQSLFPLKEK